MSVKIINHSKIHRFTINKIIEDVKKKRLIKINDVNIKKEAIEDEAIEDEAIEEYNNIDFNKLGPDHLFVFPCPNCNLLASVYKKDIRCTIFRHAAWKKDMVPVPPHSSEANLEQWKKEGLVHGCAKPFKLIVSNRGINPIKCSYI